MIYLAFKPASSLVTYHTVGIGHSDYSSVPWVVPVAMDDGIDKSSFATMF